MCFYFNTQQQACYNSNIKIIFNYLITFQRDLFIFSRSLGGISTRVLCRSASERNQFYKFDMVIIYIILTRVSVVAILCNGCLTLFFSYSVYISNWYRSSVKSAPSGKIGSGKIGLTCVCTFYFVLVPIKSYYYYWTTVSETLINECIQWETFSFINI